MCRLPKQYPAVPAMTWPPCPALCTSLMRPPVPVVAPLNGATPEGQVGCDGRLFFGKQNMKKRDIYVAHENCFGCSDQLESYVSLQWRWHVVASAVSHMDWPGMYLLGKHTPAPFLWYHWTHKHTSHWVSVKCIQTQTACVVAISTPLPAVVAELDDVVLVAVPLGVHYEAEKSLLLLLPVDHHPPTKEPVTTVLTETPGYKESNRELKKQPGMTTT